MRLGIFIFLCLTVLRAGADIIYTCDSCDSQIKSGTVWVYKQPKYTNYICDTCYKLPLRCSLCQLPAGAGHIKLGDGRVICRKDVTKVVTVEDDAVRLFWEARREVERLADGNMGLRSQQLSVKLFDNPFWTSKKVNKDADDVHVEGIAVSPITAGEFFHNVNLISGVTRQSMAMTSAHEYTHLWINENKGARTLDGDTVEAICELVSYKLAVYRRDEEQIERIKRNQYTKGKILQLIEYEKEFGFQAILQWVKSGTTASLDTKEVVEPAAAAVTAPRSESPFFVPVASAAAPAAPATLTLKGLLGSGKRRLALINDRTFEKAEEGKVRVGNKTVAVKCMDILENSVIVRVDGAEPITLTLDGK
jgi:hypothetical protein